MNRRFFAARLATLGALLGLTGGSSRGAPGRDEEETASSFPLEFDHPIKLAIASDGVTWRGASYRLVHLTQIRFSHDRDTGRVTATVRGAVTTFDNQEYEVGGALFGRAGRLLGVARVTCPVERTWLGKPLHVRKDLTLDFGISLDYTSAERFAVAISRRKILTPDQWQKSGKS